MLKYSFSPHRRIKYGWSTQSIRACEALQPRRQGLLNMVGALNRSELAKHCTPRRQGLLNISGALNQSLHTPRQGLLRIFGALKQSVQCATKAIMIIKFYTTSLNEINLTHGWSHASRAHHTCTY